MKSNLIIIGIFCFLIGCKDDADLAEIVVFDDTPYTLDVGHFPSPVLPSDNVLTVEKVKLGQMLFFDKKLSKDNIQSCAGCHNQTDGFSDTLQFSLGVRNLPGKRHAMAIINMAWNTNGFFWDGRAPQLRDQSLLPILDELEMDETHENVISKLSAEQVYLDQFVRAFGDNAITTERMSLAMEQFMLTVVSNQSKYDKFLNGDVELTEAEERGRQLYFGEFNPFFPEDSGADCEHCHGGLNFENDLFMNNGLDDDLSFVDMGREEVTLLASDRAKFKVPTLRNIAVTAPYMHDGRMSTLEEVVTHYNEHITYSSTLDPALLQVAEAGGLGLTDQDKQDLIAFLHTLTDETFLTNPAYADPFE